MAPSSPHQLGVHPVVQRALGAVDTPANHRDDEEQAQCPADHGQPCTRHPSRNTPDAPSHERNLYRRDGPLQ